MAAFIEGPPLCRIGLQPAAVGCEVAKAEFADSPLQAFAHLAAHFAEAAPPQVALRQRPLEKGCAIAIVHRTADYACLRLARPLLFALEARLIS
jgi:hypothetical protein